MAAGGDRPRGCSGTVWLGRNRSPKETIAAKPDPWPTDPGQLLALGHQHGHNGDWKPAHECFRRVIGAGSVSENDFLWATGAALAAGDTNAGVEFGRSVLELFGNDTTADVAERRAKQVLPLPNAPADLIEKPPSAPTTPPNKSRTAAGSNWPKAWPNTGAATGPKRSNG